MTDLAKIKDLEMQLESERLLRESLEDRLFKVEAKLIQEQSAKNSKEDFFGHVLDNLPADLVVFDSNHRYLYINPKAVKSQEVRDWMIGKTDFDYAEFRNKPIEIAEKRREVFQEAMRTKSPSEWVEKLTTDTGETEYHLRRFFPKFTPSGELDFMIGYALNITDQYLAQEDLIVAKEIAEKATLAKSEFLSKMTHELRTPLNAIVGLTDIMLNEERYNKDENLSSMKYSSDTLLGIINEVLDFSKIETGEVSFNSSLFSINEIVKIVKNTFDFKLREKGIDFEVLIDANVPAYIKGDRVKLNQILLNLVSNAVKFTHSGKIELRIKSIAKKEGVATLEFIIRDTGIGIEKSKLEDIFNSFYQGYNNNEREYGGTGLGLSIAKKFIELQGGSIQVTSEFGLGSTFTFTLDFEISTLEHNWQSPMNTVNATYENAKVLVAEDNVMNQLVFRKILSRWKIIPDFVADGKEALQKLETNDYDMVFMDLQMPKMNGLEATKVFRRKENKVNGARLPIVALTADSFHESRKEVAAVGMNDFLSKPIEPSELSRVLSEYLNKKATH